MSLAITSGRLTMLRRRAAETFLDTCQVGTKSGGEWGTDAGDKSFSYGSAIVCGVDLSAQGESNDGSQATLVDAVITLPHGTTITAASRIRVTHRLGVNVTDLDYQVMGTPKYGLYGLVCNCRLLTGNTTK